MRYEVTLNNKVYEVEVEEGSAMIIDEYELKAPAAATAQAAALVTTPAQSTAAQTEANTSLTAAANGEAVKSPMPGNILKINVSAGQHVEEGDVILVLEAMKMENEVVATKTGTIVQIAVTQFAVVETGTTLAVIA